MFLTFQGDSTLLVPWSFSAQTRPDGVDREVRGWLARSDTWDPFLNDGWGTPPTSAPWRILPHGPVRLVVGLGDALETILFQEGGRNLEVNLGELLVEWSGQRAQTFRVHEGTIVLSDRTVEGHVLDMSRGWAASDDPPGDWGILLSGDSLQVVLEDLEPEADPEGGAFSVRARVEFLDRQWQGVQTDLVGGQSFRAGPPGRAHEWEIESEEGDLAGLTPAVSPFLEVAEGEGPMLPVEALFQVAGTLTLGGKSFPSGDSSVTHSADRVRTSTSSGPDYRFWRPGRGPDQHRGRMDALPSLRAPRALRPAPHPISGCDSKEPGPPGGSRREDGGQPAPDRRGPDPDLRRQQFRGAFDDRLSHFLEAILKKERGSIREMLPPHRHGGVGVDPG